MAGSSGLGPFVLMCTVSGSIFVTLSMELMTPFMSEVGCRARSIEKTTSSALNSSPSWNFTFGRSLNSHTVGSLVTDQERASSGSSLPSRVRCISGS